MKEGEEGFEIKVEVIEDNHKTSQAFWDLLHCPSNWLKKLSRETHWSLVFGIVVVYGISQGVGGALTGVAVDYYWKDVQKIQPSEAQVYHGITSIPWLVKPIWGLLTDVLPLAGYRRKPYFIFAGVVGMISMLILSLHSKLHIAFALLSLTAGSAGVAIADVVIDACVAQNSIIHPSLAADFQSLCALCSSLGALLGFLVSGILVHLIGSKGVLGLLTIPSSLILIVGVVMKDSQVPDFAYRQVHKIFMDASRSMWTTIKCPHVWRPCLYMYVSFALSLNIHEGWFYWLTDPKQGPGFSQEMIGFMSSVGSLGSLIGTLLFQSILKDYPFRGLFFWTQLLYGMSGMLDLLLVFRLNLVLGLPDFFFAVIDESISQMIGRIKWMPLLVLSSKLCPSGIEGTFFALLMSIDNTGLLTSSWLGGLFLHILNVTRTKFHNLWLVILIRNLMRILPLALIFLVPASDPNSCLLPDDMLAAPTSNEEGKEPKNVELVSLLEGV